MNTTWAVIPKGSPASGMKATACSCEPRAAARSAALSAAPPGIPARAKASRVRPSAMTKNPWSLMTISLAETSGVQLWNGATLGLVLSFGGEDGRHGSAIRSPPSRTSAELGGIIVDRLPRIPTT